MYMSIIFNFFAATCMERIQSLDKKFDQLHDKLVTTLTTKEISSQISVDTVLQSLTKLPFIFRCTYENAIRKMIPELEKQPTIHKLFLRINPLFTFIDYELLEHLISKFGSQMLNKEMSVYADQVKLFKKETTVGDLIDVWPGVDDNDNYTQLKIKFDDDPNTYTLEKLDDFRRRFCNMLRLSDYISVFILKSLKAACSFYSVWLIPTVIATEVMDSASKVNSSFYEEENVVHVSLCLEKTLFPFSVTKSVDTAFESLSLKSMKNESKGYTESEHDKESKKSISSRSSAQRESLLTKLRRKIPSIKLSRLRPSRKSQNQNVMLYVLQN